MSEMVERVARAIRDAQRLYGSAHEEVVARAAIEAMREPGLKMMLAERLVRDTSWSPDIGAIYRAMIDAALAEGTEAATTPS